MRLFIAAEIPEELQRRLGEAQRRLAGLPLEVRWVRPEGIHLTLAFLGETAEERRALVETAMERVVHGGPPPFRLLARGIGTFPERGRPRVIWAGLLGDVEVIERLQGGLKDALAEAGWTLDDRPFHPHLTLGRVTGARSGDPRPLLEALAVEEFGTIEVRRIALFESRLGAGGARYSVLSAAELPATAAAR